MKLDGAYLRMRVIAWYEGIRPLIRQWPEHVWNRRWTIVRYSVYTIAGGALLSGLLFVMVYFGVFGPLPAYGALRDIQNNMASEVYSADGVLLGRYYIENRVNADFAEIPLDLVNALVATEDARFFEHSGVDARALARVALKTVLMADRSAGGGSTLSQQLAKNLYPRQKYGLLTIPVNKVREIFIARRLEKLYTKEELLRLYLNTVPFGENIYGIKVAAQRFFNKSAGALRTEEAAVLVGMLKANTYYNPLKHPERAKSRRNVVLQQMERYGYLEAKTCDSLQQLPLVVEASPVRYDQGPATYFRAHLQQVLERTLKNHPKPDGSAYNLYTDGLKIYTTLDSRLQQHAERAVQAQMARIQQEFQADWARSNRAPWGTPEDLLKAIRGTKRYQNARRASLSEEDILMQFNEPVPMDLFSWDKDRRGFRQISPLDSLKQALTLLNAGFLAIEPATGLIKAWVGGIDHHYVQYDHVKSKRQIGSTFKPLVYTQALEQGMDPCRYLSAARQTYPDYDNWSPRNADGHYDGYYSMEGALRESINTVTVSLLLNTGIDSVRAFAQKMGLTAPMPHGPAIGLGTVNGSLLELTRLYSTYANGGRQPILHYLDRIETVDGETVVAFNRPSPARFQRKISPETNAAMVRMLQSVVDSGTARRLRYEFGLRQDLAGKTGTTQNQSDGWFVGFSPDIVASAWVGAETPNIHFRTMRAGQGSNTALPIVGHFLKLATSDPAFRSWRTSRFAPLPDSLRFFLDCPPYFEELPIAEDLFEVYQENPGFFQDLYRELRRQEAFRGADLDVKRRRNGESDQEYFDRMTRYNERLQRRDARREALKNFWSEKLFGQKKEREGG